MVSQYLLPHHSLVHLFPYISSTQKYVLLSFCLKKSAQETSSTRPLKPRQL